MWWCLEGPVRDPLQTRTETECGDSLISFSTGKRCPSNSIWLLGRINSCDFDTGLILSLIWSVYMQVLFNRVGICFTSFNKWFDNVLPSIGIWSCLIKKLKTQLFPSWLSHVHIAAVSQRGVNSVLHSINTFLAGDKHVWCHCYYHILIFLILCSW